MWVFGLFHSKIITTEKDKRANRLNFLVWAIAKANPYLPRRKAVPLKGILSMKELDWFPVSLSSTSDKKT